MQVEQTRRRAVIRCDRKTVKKKNFTLEGGGGPKRVRAEGMPKGDLAPSKDGEVDKFDRSLMRRKTENHQEGLTEKQHQEIKGAEKNEAPLQVMGDLSKGGGHISTYEKRTGNQGLLPFLR